jgi:hypothetical protein
MEVIFVLMNRKFVNINLYYSIIYIILLLLTILYTLFYLIKLVILVMSVLMMIYNLQDMSIYNTIFNNTK